MTFFMMIPVTGEAAHCYGFVWINIFEWFGGAIFFIFLTEDFVTVAPH